jgi:hypothetical protein
MPRIEPTGVSVSRKINDGSYGSLEFSCAVAVTWDEPEEPDAAAKTEAVRKAFAACALAIQQEQERRGIRDGLVGVRESVQGKPVRDADAPEEPPVPSPGGTLTGQPISIQQIARAARGRGQVAPNDAATPAQVRAIYLIARDQHGLTDQTIDERSTDLYGSVPAELTKRQASDLITMLRGGTVPS